MMRTRYAILHDASYLRLWFWNDPSLSSTSKFVEATREDNEFLYTLHIKILAPTEDLTEVGSVMSNKDDVSVKFSLKYGRNVQTRLINSFSDISDRLLKQAARANILTCRL